MATFLKIGVFGSVVLVAMGGTAVIPPDNNEQFSQTKARYTASTNCTIKGNISYGSREKIYHVQGQKYYDVTEIRPYYGERWFCSEADARTAGWRRAWQ
ncbi:MAG: hypothetical protein AAGF25_14475 [Pseudomonadota bacterium]